MKRVFPNFMKSTLAGLAMAGTFIFLTGISEARTITADVVALDQVITLNRFGSITPAGMMYALRRDVVHSSTDSAIDGTPIGTGGLAGQVRLRDGKRPRPLVLRANVGDTLEVKFTNLLAETRPNPDSPRTRRAAMVAIGLTPSGTNHVQRGIVGVDPGMTATYIWVLDAASEGPHLFFSLAAPGGGEGDAGTTPLGLFGAINVEPLGSEWYRSQVTQADMAEAKSQKTGSAFINYEAVYSPDPLLPHIENGDPILNMLKLNGDGSYQIIHSDLNAIIRCDDSNSCVDPDDGLESTTEGTFREFTAIMHDELHTKHGFQQLDEAFVFSSVRDHFAINYGSQGMGSILLANRGGIGPAADCVECAYEEFFLTSWANGDPALLVDYLDDPSNVHHSYNNDHVVFRNLHAGVEEGHVFHLHNHQWLAETDEGNSTYLDSQTILPTQAFTYEISYGGSGNRNGSIGDSIFHCHLYPHFAQGMWELWRVHDVFEDGSRRLPDGELGRGTHPMTGINVGNDGTPIPALIPIPGIAMAPIPTYPCPGGNPTCTGTALKVNAMPGYPFFMDAEAGHRPPQPPWDMHKHGGLPRHRVTGGTRTTVDGPVDFSVHLDTLNIQLIDPKGSPLEKAAIAWHCNGIVNAMGNVADCGTGTHMGSLPEDVSVSEEFVVNGRAPQHGSPFADPCDPLLKEQDRYYHVSAIQINLKVNDYGWYDPQARINVLDTVADDPNIFSGSGPHKAEPFFFRANSGDCINYFHTNRTPHELELDPFQVKTPTDVIGQHIHLVKFDVTASDGSVNGWNYEDGTFSPDAIAERRLAASKPTGSLTDTDGNEIYLADIPADGDFQTTVQRWFADPLQNLVDTTTGVSVPVSSPLPASAPAGTKWVDRTIRTVFTHDHFAPSSIQQHGFYSALLIEPKGSSWYKAGTATTEANNRANNLGDLDNSADGVGTQYRIEGGDDSEDHREFAMAVADFALVFDSSGNPINKPPAPEAVSAEDPGTFLVNYRNDPAPLRISTDGSASGLRVGLQGDMAYLFSSIVHGGDPDTEVFKAYEGDRIQLRLVQGAHEEPHVFSVNGMRWRREISNPNSPYVAGQEIGLSEHFEMGIPRLPMVRRGAQVADYLYHFQSRLAMWNGNWGLIRTFKSPTTRDPATMTYIGEEHGGSLVKLSNNLNPGMANVVNWRDIGPNGCPRSARPRYFSIEAWAAKNLLGPGVYGPGTGDPVFPKGVVYNDREDIYDPSALVYILAEDRVKIEAGLKNTLDPLVIRANAGECIRVRLTNKLTSRMSPEVPDHLGDAGMMPITNLKIDDFRPSKSVGIHPQLVEYDIRFSDGVTAGFNRRQTASPGRYTYYAWYAGTFEYTNEDLSGNILPGGKVRVIPTPVAFGPINLQPFGDVIKQSQQGLVGALIIEPQGATYHDPETDVQITSGTVARIRYVEEGTQKAFKEFVLIYQDGLNLKKGASLVPDTFTTEDAEDFGEKSVNYGTEPFCIRLGQSNDCDSGDLTYPAKFFLDDVKTVETPVLTATPGEAVRFLVLHPSGQQSEKGFTLLGHDFPEIPGQPKFGSSGSAHVGIGRVITAIPDGGAKEGTWIYRDTPANQFVGGSWGLFKVECPAGETCP